MYLTGITQGSCLLFNWKNWVFLCPLGMQTLQYVICTGMKRITVFCFIMNLQQEIQQMYAIGRPQSLIAVKLHVQRHRMYVLTPTMVCWQRSPTRWRMITLDVLEEGM